MEVQTRIICFSPSFSVSKFAQNNYHDGEDDVKEVSSVII